MLAAVCLCSAGATTAGSLTVTPVRLTLAAGRPAGVLTVVNNDSESTLIQLEVMRWSQVEGVDQLEPSRELLATPPIFTVAAGGSQIVRIGLRGTVPRGPKEAAYRLLLTEVPPSPVASKQGVKILLSISLPVFVEPAVTVVMVPVLHWHARRAEGGLVLRADNDGPMHVQVTGLRLDRGEPLTQFKAAYLLPGAHREWKLLNDAAAGSVLTLQALTDAGELAADVVVTAP